MGDTSQSWPLGDNVQVFLASCTVVQLRSAGCTVVQVRLAGCTAVQVHLDHCLYKKAGQDAASGRHPPAVLLPVHDVGQEVVVPQPVLRVHLLVVHRQGPVQDAPLLDEGSGSE